MCRVKVRQSSQTRLILGDPGDKSLHACEREDEEETTEMGKNPRTKWAVTLLSGSNRVLQGLGPLQVT